MQKTQKSKRNGKIEFLRFVFCMAVLLFHCCKYVLGEPSCEKGYHLSLFCHGSMGVEFFFLVSGVLMAKTAYKKNEFKGNLSGDLDGKALAADSLQFLKGKYLGIFPMHVLAFVFAFVTYAVAEKLHWLKILSGALESIPNLFLVQMTGMGMVNPNHVTWYISCMLIAMAVLYPLCRKYYTMFTHYIAPLSAVLLLGYCMKTTGRLTGVSHWSGICYKSVLRAIIEIALGAAAFEIARHISGRKYKKAARNLFAAAEFLLFACIMVYCVGTFPHQWEQLELAALFLLVTLAFSGVSSGAGFFDNAVFFHLGKLSLPLYLTQVGVINIVTGLFDGLPHRRQILVIVAGTFAAAYVLLWMEKGIRYIFDSRRNMGQRGTESL